MGRNQINLNKYLCGRNANHMGVGMSPVSKRRSNTRYGVPALYT